MTGLLKTFSRMRFLDSLQQDANRLPHRQFPRLQFILDSTDRIICRKHQSYCNLTCPRPYRASLLLPATNHPPPSAQHSRPSSIMLSPVEHGQPYLTFLLDTSPLLQINQSAGRLYFWLPFLFHLPDTIPEFPLSLITLFIFCVPSSYTYCIRILFLKLAQFSCFTHESISLLCVVFMFCFQRNSILTHTIPHSCAHNRHYQSIRAHFPIELFTASVSFSKLSSHLPKHVNWRWI